VPCNAAQLHFSTVFPMPPLNFSKPGAFLKFGCPKGTWEPRPIEEWQGWHQR
jgi:hypothetical protein